jgi:hypothetical protein
MVINQEPDNTPVGCKGAQGLTELLEMGLSANANDGSNGCVR